MAGAQEVAFEAISSIKASRHRTDVNIYYREQPQQRLKNIDFAARLTPVAAV